MATPNMSSGYNVASDHMLKNKPNTPGIGLGQGDLDLSQIDQKPSEKS